VHAIPINIKSSALMRMQIFIDIVWGNENLQNLHAAV